MKQIRFDIFTSIGTMFIAWFIGYILHAIYQVHYSNWGKVTDFSAIYFWTGLFALITAIFFVRLIIKTSNKTNRPLYSFYILTTLGGPISMFILLLPLTAFQPWTMGWYFYVYSMVIGLTFGLLYNRLHWISDSKIKQVMVIALPIGIQLVIFKILPLILPSVAYQYFGDSIRSKATEKVLSETKIGDSIYKLNKRLPGFADFVIESGQGQTGGSNELVEYSIEYEDFKVKEIELKERK